jgi:DNA replication protein DnaC
MNSNGFECPELFDWLDKMQDFSQVSITSLECIHAARLSSSRTPRPTVFFYERQIVEDAKHKIPDDRRWIFDFEFVNKEIKNPDRKHQYTLDKEGATAKKDDRDKLNEFLKSQDHIIYRDYTSRYSHSKITDQRGDGKKFGVGYTKKLEEFQSRVENDLLSAILENYDQFDNSQMDKFQLESIQHENAVREKASMFVGREDLIGTAQRFLEKEHKMMRTMILHGEPGCGKSGLLAALAHQTIEKYRKNGDFVFVHIVDSCPGSALLEGFLRRLNVSLRIFRRAQGETNLDKNPPKEASKLKDEHHSFMNESAQKYPNTKFIIIVDAVNQLNSSMLAWDMWWLSNQAAPTNLKFLISTLNEENKTFENALEMCINAVCVPVLEMKRADLKAMVRGALQRFNKKLTETNDPLLGNQMDILVNKSTSPLYLMAACEVSMFQCYYLF